MKTNNLIIILVLLFTISFVTTGCHDKEFDEEAPFGSNVKYITNDPGYRKGEEVPYPVLSSGEILKIRLVYEIREKDEDNNEWYQVDLKREESKWSDLVKIEGLIRSKERHWDDFTFFSTNFNWQVEKDYYGTPSLDGVYDLTITGSNGYYQNYRLNRKDGRWTNIAGAEMFYVP